MISLTIPVWIRRAFANTLRALPIGFAAVASHAYANWTIVRADARVTIVHEASRYDADVGQTLAPDDIVETPASADMQIQDDSGNIVALGQATRVLLAGDAHIAVLQGWVKLLHTCGNSGNAHCATPMLETALGTITPGDDTSLVMVSSPGGYDGAHDEATGAVPADEARRAAMRTDAVFCESGTATMQNGAPVHGAPPPAHLSATQFAVRRASSAASASSASTVSTSVVGLPDRAFVAAMPVAFRDALRPLRAPPAASGEPAAQPVSYADVADWLTSGLAVRTRPATRFTARFRTRLSDPAFRRAIDLHLHDLPEWRPLLYPPPRVARRAAPSSVPAQYRSMFARP